MHNPPPSLPASAGIGLRAPHYAEFVATRPAVAFIEAHSENYFGRGGIPHHYLGLARRDYPLSLHGVGLSIGSIDPLAESHLQRLAELVDRFEPALVSDHLCWTSIGGIHANDLLPLPYTEEALAHVVGRVQQVQEALGRTILLENVSSYFEYAQSVLPEPVFLAEVARRSGCGILLDVNNVFVSAHNHGRDASAWLDDLPAQAVQEIHLAGFTRKAIADSGEILIDTHGAPVADAVWALYAETLARLGPRPTLIEWDTDLPPLASLVGEAAKADRMLTQVQHHARAA